MALLMNHFMHTQMEGQMSKSKRLSCKTGFINRAIGVNVFLSVNGRSGSNKPHLKTTPRKSHSYIE